MRYYRTILDTFSVDRFINDAVRDTIKQERVLSEGFITMVKKNVEMAWTRHKSKTYFHCHPIRFHLRPKKRQTKEKIRWQHYWVNWKLIHRAPDNGTQPRHVGGFGLGAQLHSDLTTTLSHGTNDDGDDNDDDDDDEVVEIVYLALFHPLFWWCIKQSLLN